MRGQYDQMGAMFDWSREVITCTPEYYRWNQWFFLQMLEARSGLPEDGAVWWCPNDQTVLANEQVLEGNTASAAAPRSTSATWSSGSSASPTTPTSCCDDTDGLDWPERVKTMQRNWIGRSEGRRDSASRLETGDDRWRSSRRGRTRSSA